MRVPQPVPPDLAAAARWLDSWRRRRRTRDLPAKVWDRAAKLAGRHGVSATARALRLDYYRIKARQGVAMPVAPRRRSQLRRDRPEGAGPGARVPVARVCRGVRRRPQGADAGAAVSSPVCWTSWTSRWS